MSTQSLLLYFDSYYVQFYYDSGISIITSKSHFRISMLRKELNWSSILNVLEGGRVNGT